MYIPMWVLILLIATNVLALLLLFFIIYGICVIKDLFFVRYKKEDNKCPYEIEVDHK